MCGIVLQCVAGRWSVLQCVAVCCSVLQRKAPGTEEVRVLRHDAVCCSVLQRVAACCSIFLSSEVRVRTQEWGGVYFPPPTRG